MPSEKAKQKHGNNFDKFLSKPLRRGDLIDAMWHKSSFASVVQWKEGIFLSSMF
jgi:hypothetical protein